VRWQLNLTVTTEDLPPYASSISEVRARALQAIAAAAGRRNGKIYREVMADLVEDFGRKAVDDAVAASQRQPGLANVAGGRPAGEAAGTASVEAPTSVVEMVAPPSRWHCGQRPLTAPNLRRAGISPQGFDREGNAQWKGSCPKCYAGFLIKTDTLRATCRCKKVTWRMNVAVITHDFPPHPWHPETVRKQALRSLYAQNHWNASKASAKFLTDLEKEFEKDALFYSIIEV
jgi:hypothetical protein